MKEMAMWRALPLLCVLVFPALRLGAQVSDPTANAAGTILVYPFEIAQDSTARWIGRGAQEDLITDLTQATRSRIKSPAEPLPAANAAAALKHARELDATIVIYGQAQVVDLNVRLTGQVLEVATGRVLGAIKVTGPLSELFALEDALAREVFAALPQDLLKPEVLQYLQDTSGPPPAGALPSDAGPTTYPPSNVLVGPAPANYEPTIYEPVNPPYAPLALPTVPIDVPSLGWAYPYGLSGFDLGWWWTPGTIIVVSPLPPAHVEHHHKDGHSEGGHRQGGHGRWDGGNQQPGSGSSPNQMVNGNGASNPVPVQFTWGGVAAPGSVGGALVQSAPHPTFGGAGFSRGGFTTMSGPRMGRGFHSFSGFGGGLGFTGRGGTVGR
jgi:TolB-like protein